jgi:glycosyltransferase involved in cell wall biosynthesis
VRILWVVPRFGADTVGGAEVLVRALALRGGDEGWTMEVAATCATDHMNWADDLPPGESIEDGVRVHRFPVGTRDAARYETLHARVLSGGAAYVDELEWLAHSVWSQQLHTFLGDTAGAFDLVVFSPYLFGTSIWGAQVAPDRSALLPCLHDEPYAYLRTVAGVVRSVRGCLFNTEAERRLAERLYGPVPGGVVGMGFDPPGAPPAADFAGARDLEPGGYLVYAGRLEEGKRVDVLVDHVTRYAAERRDAPRLVLIGRGPYRPPRSARQVVLAGFVGEEEKRAAFAGALALVNPSTLESLSLTLLEAWREGTPGLVSAGSEVMREHTSRSGGGLTFTTYEEFRDAVDTLTGDPERRRGMGEAGRAYVLEEYGWPPRRRATR